MAVQPDPYFALPSLRGAPAYSRPPRPGGVVQRPLDPDDLPLATDQTEEERRLAGALLASRNLTSLVAAMGHGLTAGADPGSRVSGNGGHDRPHGPGPRHMSIRGLTERIRTRR